MFSLRLLSSLYRPARLLPIRTTPVNAAAALRFKSKKSSSGGRHECAKDNAPICGPKNVKKLKKTGCDGKSGGKGKKKHTQKFEFKSMWENPDCCKNPCPDMQVRFDEIYYKTSDKAKRTYYQTWVECPKKKIVKKPVCDYKNFIYPKHKKRTRKGRPKTACSTSDDSKILMKCTKKTNSKCVKITLPGCRGVRDPPKCKKVTSPADCRKICTPYPSFSECKKPKPKPKRRVECNCLRILSMCDVWAELRRRNTMKK